MDLAAVRDFLSRKEAARQALLDARFAQATADFDRIVKHLSKRPDIRRIWQWGSLLDRSRFSEISDLDLALEGVPGPEAFFDILGQAEALTTFPLDIVELEKVGEANARHIRETGRLVYERH